MPSEEHGGAEQANTSPEQVRPEEQPEAQHLHPLSWLFIAGAWLKNMLVPVVIFLVVSRRGGDLSSSYEVWSVLFIVPAMAGAVIKFWLVRYTLAADELIVRGGLLVRNERHIPYGRIQNIDLVQNPLHRMLDVALVRIETAGGNEPEAVLRVLSMDAIEQMRSRVFAGRGAADLGAPERRDGAEADEAQTPPDEGTVPAGAGDGSMLLRLSNMELVKLGLISNRGFVIVAAALGVVWQFDWWEWVGLGEWLRDPSEWDTQINRLLNDGAAGAAGASPFVEWLLQRNTIVLGAIFGFALMLLLLILLRLFSIAWHLITLHGYTLRRRGDDLRADYGLFTRVSQTIPTPRIQLISTRQSPLHRWFGSASVRVETAGGGGGGDGDEQNFEGLPKTQRDWLAPLIDADRVAALVRSVLPEIDLDAVDWCPIPERAWKRVFKEACVVLIPAVVLTTVLAGAWGLAVLIGGGAWAYAYARGYTRNAAFALTPRAIVFRDGWLVRRLSAVRFTKTQTVSVRSTPFDRRHSMASLRVDTAGAGKVGHKVAIPYLEADDASAISRRLYDEAAHTEFRW